MSNRRLAWYCKTIETANLLAFGGDAFGMVTFVCGRMQRRRKAAVSMAGWRLAPLPFPFKLGVSLLEGTALHLYTFWVLVEVAAAVVLAARKGFL